MEEEIKEVICNFLFFVLEWADILNKREMSDIPNSNATTKELEISVEGAKPNTEAIQQQFKHEQELGTLGYSPQDRFEQAKTPINVAYASYENFGSLSNPEKKLLLID